MKNVGPKDYFPVPLYRVNNELDENHHRRCDAPELVGTVYACARARRSNETNRNQGVSGTTEWDVAIREGAPAMTARDGIVWEGRFLQFNGKPYPDGKTCDFCVRAVECDCETMGVSDDTDCGCDEASSGIKWFDNNSTR